MITGDITQIDLPNPRKSGLIEAMNMLEGVDGIRFIHFEDGDVVRHHLVQRMIRAYDNFGRAQQELPLRIERAKDRSGFEASVAAVEAGGERPLRVPSK